MCNIEHEAYVLQVWATSTHAALALDELIMSR